MIFYAKWKNLGSGLSGSENNHNYMGNKGAVKKVRPAVLKITVLHDLPLFSRRQPRLFSQPLFRGFTQSANGQIRAFDW